MKIPYNIIALFYALLLLLGTINPALSAPYGGGGGTFNNNIPPSSGAVTKVNGVSFPATPTIGTTPIVTATNTITYKPEFVLLGTVAIDFSNTTAMKVGTTPNNGKLFCIQALIMTAEATTGTPSLNGATTGMGVIAGNYSDIFFNFLASSLLNAGQAGTLSASAGTSETYVQPNTDVYFKMQVPISGGTVTGHASVYGINCS